MGWDPNEASHATLSAKKRTTRMVRTPAPIDPTRLTRAYRGARDRGSRFLAEDEACFVDRA